jgi:hypothetical protein
MQFITQKAFADALMKNKSFGIDVRTGVMATIEQLKPAATNLPAGGTVKSTTTTLRRENASLQAATAQLQGAFNGGAAGQISIVMCAESHDYQNPRPVKTPKLKAKALGDAQKYWDLSEADRLRANGLLATMGGAAYPQPDLVIFERKMGYNAPAGISTAREDALMTPTGYTVNAGQNLDGRQRSFAVAGYIFLCVAGGAQNQHDRVVLFFGENHTDIFDHIDYFAQHTTVDWVQKRARSYTIISSNCP